MSTTSSRVLADRFYSVQAIPQRRLWLHVALLVLTLFSTMLVGAALELAFRADRAPAIEDQLNILIGLRSAPGVLLLGLPFSLTLLAILFAHEMGHYMTCQRYGIDASLPYFLPAPGLIGTLGAFIRIRSPIYSRRQLFDVGVAGPLAGFAVLVPVLAVGMALSRVHIGIAAQGEFAFGTPLLLRLAEISAFPHVSSADIALHPVAQAALFGMLATALNLLPIGQLDGGHILYSLVGNRHKLLSRIFLAALIPLAVFCWEGWLVLAAILFFFGMRHPTICDIAPLGTVRVRLALAALILFLLCFTVAPLPVPLLNLR